MDNGGIKRSHWGKMLDGSDVKKNIKLNELILPSQKTEKVKLTKIDKEEQNDIILTIDNPLVTQTVEVMNQTEMIQGLIDTYTTNSAYNSYILNTSQVMPNIDLPLDTTANLVKNEKFQKPIWYIPPNETKFTCGIPRAYPKINKPIVMEAVRKSIAGILRLKSFNECTESALVMFMDAVDEFYKCLLDNVNLILVNEYKDKIKHLDVTTLEKGYFSLTNSSLLSLHNYYKNEILQRNKTEIKEFKDIFQEYDKLKQESQNIKKYPIKEEDYLGNFDFTGTSSGPMQHDGSGTLNYISTGNATNIKMEPST